MRARALSTRDRRIVALACALVGLIGPGPARAQFGFGYGFGGYYYNPANPESLLQSQSLQNGARATMGPVENRPYAGSSNAYYNHIRDDSARYDVSSRRSSESEFGRYGNAPTSGPTPPRPSRAPAGPRDPSPPATPPPIPLSSFFDRYDKLVWPAEAPSFGDLGKLRATSDQASLAVLNEYKLRGLATLGNVTEARKKLIEYGKPALKYARDNSTPRVADTFHLFLMSLYESLAQASTTPRPADAKPAPSGATPSRAPAPAPAPAAPGRP